MIKKKFHGGVRLLYLLLFFMAFVTYSNNCKAYTSIQDPELTLEEFKAVLNELEFTQISGDTNIQNMKETYNRWVRVMLTSGYEFQLSNIVFYKSSTQNTLYWTLNNGTVGNLPYLYLSNNSNGTGTIQATLPNIYLGNFLNWTYNNSGDITGANSSNLTYYYIPTSNFFSTYQGTGRPNVYTSNENSINNNEIYLKYAVTFFKPLSSVYARQSQYGPKTYFLSHILDLDRTINPTITPTPTTTPTQSGGEGENVDLTQTNQKIDDVKNAVDNIKNSVDTVNQSVEEVGGKIDTLDTTITDTFDSDTNNIDTTDISLETEQYEIDDPTENFFTWLLEQIQNVLTTNEISTITVEIFDDTFTIRSDFFVIDDGVLKTFLVAYYTFIVGYFTIKDIRKIVENFKNGNIEAIGKDDINANIV